MIHRAAGAPGLVLFHAALALAVFGVLLLTARLGRADPTSLVVILLLGGIASEMRFEVRPEVLSHLLLALVLYVLHRRAEGRASPLWLLPLLHLVWANTHGLFVLGWGAIACFAAGLWLRERRFDRRLAGWGIASVAVTVINPYGWRGMVFPFTLATRLQEENVFAQSIGEFVSPFALRISERFPFYPRAPIISFRAFAIVSLVALLPLLLRRRFWCGFLWVAFMVLAARMIRNVPLFVIAALPATAWGLPLERLVGRATRRRTATRSRPRRGRERADEGPDRDPSAAPAGGRERLDVARGHSASDGVLPAFLKGAWRRFPEIVSAAAALAAVAIGLRVFHDAYYVQSRRVERFGLGWNRLTLPVDAVRHADRAGLPGPVLNYLDFGGYLMWARPDPVFVDGRLEVIGEEFYQYYRRCLASDQALEACVARYGIRWMIFPYVGNPDLLGRLGRDTRWRLAYVDPIAVIFVREGPSAGAYVDPDLAARLGDAPAAPGTIPPLGATDGPPATSARSAPSPGSATATEPSGGDLLAGPRLIHAPDIRSLPGLGGPPLPGVVARWLTGLVRRAEFPIEEYNMGLFLLYRGDLDRAEARFARAIERSGGAYYEAYNNLGAVLWRKRRFDDAARCYEIVLAHDPANRIARERAAGRRSGPS